ncbi:MAG: pilus assembly protein PilM [Planctomycetes bacterium]|nr:pilus assembly protein PilM [Planctomycetota bacterium]
MARAVGLDAGVHEVKVVELDGSYRKPRLAKVSIDRVPGGASAELVAQGEARAALHALKDQHIKLDTVNLGYPCRDAVLRTLKIPFVGDDAIRKVIKFEAENSIHSHSVDDMVVDFLTFERGEGESSVLVAAVPKKSLGTLLEALEAEGLEPERVELDTMALYRVAEWAGCFGEEAAKKAAAAAESAGAQASAVVETVTGRRARIVIDVGAGSTRALAVVDGKLVDMRAIRIGTESIAEELAAELKLPVEKLRDAVREALVTGEDVALPADEAAAAAPEPAEGETTELPARASVVPHELVEKARKRFLERLGREILRFMTALPRISEVERVYYTGGASQLPGVTEVLKQGFECEIEPLDVLGRLSHGLSEDEVQKIGPRIAVAVGLALGMMGAAGGFDFRREQFAYKRRFDRVKFPLAIVAMLAVFLPFIAALRVRAEVSDLEKRYGQLFEVQDAAAARGESRVKARFWGHVGRLMSAGSADNLQRYLGPQEFEKLTRDIIARPTFERLPVIRERLGKQLTAQQESTGIYENLQLPSGVQVLSAFSETLQSIERDLGEFLVTEVDLSLPATKGQKYLQVRFAFRGEDYRQRFTKLQEALQSTFGNGSSPFSGFGRAQQGSAGEEVFADPSTPGAYYWIRLEVRDDFQAESQG